MRELTYAQALREAMTLEMRRDEDVFLMGEDIGVYGGTFGVTAGMLEEFGSERVRETPISEAAIVGAAAGTAVTGMRPIAEIMFSDFLTIAMDQLVNQAAKMRYMFGGSAKVPMVVRRPGRTCRRLQHSQSPEAWFCSAGPQGGHPVHAGGRQGLALQRHPRRQPGAFPGQKLLYKTIGPVPEGEYIVPLEQSGSAP